MTDSDNPLQQPSCRSLWIAVLPLAGLMMLLGLDAILGHLLNDAPHQWKETTFWPIFATTLLGGGLAMFRGFPPTSYSWISLGSTATLYMSFPISDWSSPHSWAGASISILLILGFLRTCLRGWRHAAFWAILISSQTCLVTAIDVGHQANTLLWFSGVTILNVILAYITYNYYRNLYNPGIYLWIIGMVLLNTLVLAFVDGQLHALHPNRIDNFSKHVVLINALLILFPSLSWAYGRLRIHRPASPTR